MKKSLRVLFAVTALGLFARAASASPIIYSLNDPNSGVSGFPNPFGGVAVGLVNSTTADVVFLANESHPNAITFGGAGAIDLNVNINGTGLLVGSIGESNTLGGGGFSLTPAPTTTILAGQNIDGRGTFNVVVDNFDGFGHSATRFAFQMINVGGTWNTASDVLFNNSLGNAVAVHAFVCSDAAALCGVVGSSALTTGFVADGATGKPTLFCENPAGCDTPTPVPEPASLALLGSGLIGAGIRRWRNRRTAA